MTALKLELQTTDTELLFNYTGKQLSAPLKALIRWQTARIEKLAKEVTTAKNAEPVVVSPRAGDLLKRPRWFTQEERLKMLLIARDDARLWFEECRRVPSASYKLTMMQLKMLYRQKLDPRTDS